MEMLVVVAIIVVLAGAGTLGYMKIMEDARRDQARSGCKTLEKALQAYKLRHGSYPELLEHLVTNVEADQGGALIDRNALKDPWGFPYMYGGPQNLHPDTQVPQVYSQGPNRQGMYAFNWNNQ